jgi:molybdopterin-binding protein
VLGRVRIDIGGGIIVTSSITHEPLTKETDR